MPSSSGDGTTYDVVAGTLFNDSLCTCPGFQFRETCKHIRLVGNNRCDYHRGACETDMKDWWDGKLGKCPTCSGPLIVYELDPEFD